jgi:hypothetical protein
MLTLSQGIDRIQSRPGEAERHVNPRAPLQLARGIVRMPIRNCDKFIAPLTLGDRIMKLNPGRTRDAGD